MVEERRQEEERRELNFRSCDGCDKINHAAGSSEFHDESTFVTFVMTWIEMPYLSTSAMTPEDQPFSDVGVSSVVGNTRGCVERASATRRSSQPHSIRLPTDTVTAAGLPPVRNGVREREGTYLCTA
jgi:hypothetical protein